MKSVVILHKRIRWISIKKIFFIIFLFSGLNIKAQNYFINFSASGASTDISMVKVENLTTGITLTLNGSDILRLAGTVVTNQSEVNIPSGLKIYPNPTIDNSTVEIYPPVAGNVIISIFEMSGKLATQFQGYLDNGKQEFRLSDLNNGIYFISVRGNSYRYSGKILCNGRSSGNISLEKISSNQAGIDKMINETIKGDQSTIYMPYSSGEKLKFTGISGDYTTIKTDIPTQSMTITFDFIDLKDGDNNTYPVVEIGTQVWMAENLKTTRYINGDSIGTTNPPELDISGEPISKYQWAYGGNESNVAKYGRIYTWFALTDNRSICPPGWHIPSDAEWLALTEYLINNGYGYISGGGDIGKSLATTSGWTASSVAGTPGNDQASNNSSGFTAIPGGVRFFNGAEGLIDEYVYWWSSTEYDSSDAWYWIMGYDSGYVNRYHESNKANGGSARCIRDY